MKTAKEILDECELGYELEYCYDIVIKAMKAYAQQVAEQVRQECADNAFKIYKDNGMTNLADRAKQSILSTPIELI